MVFETTTSSTPDEVMTQARRFFAERVPQYAAFPEKGGPGWMTLRGQGGEEIAIAAGAADGLTRVRASTFLFDQQVSRFLSTLPPAPSA